MFPFRIGFVPKQFKWTDENNNTMFEYTTPDSAYESTLNNPGSDDTPSLSLESRRANLERYAHVMEVEQAIVVDDRGTPAIVRYDYANTVFNNGVSHPSSGEGPTALQTHWHARYQDHGGYDNYPDTLQFYRNDNPEQAVATFTNPFHYGAGEGFAMVTTQPDYFAMIGESNHHHQLIIYTTPDDGLTWTRTVSRFNQHNNLNTIQQTRDLSRIYTFYSYQYVLAWSSNSSSLGVGLYYFDKVNAVVNHVASINQYTRPDGSTNSLLNSTRHHCVFHGNKLYIAYEFDDGNLDIAEFEVSDDGTVATQTNVFTHNHGVTHVHHVYFNLFASTNHLFFTMNLTSPRIIDILNRSDGTLLQRIENEHFITLEETTFLSSSLDRRALRLWSFNDSVWEFVDNVYTMTSYGVNDHDAKLFQGYFYLRKRITRKNYFGIAPMIAPPAVPIEDLLEPPLVYYDYINANYHSGLGYGGSRPGHGPLKISNDWHVRFIDQGQYDNYTETLQFMRNDDPGTIVSSFTYPQEYAQGRGASEGWAITVLEEDYYAQIREASKNHAVLIYKRNETDTAWNRVYQQEANAQQGNLNLGYQTHKFNRFTSYGRVLAWPSNGSVGIGIHYVDLDTNTLPRKTVINEYTVQTGPRNPC